MELSHNIKLHEDSIKQIEKVYSMYEEVEWSSNKIISNPIIHMKATEDTRDENGDLHGYHDCLLFTLYVFDTSSMTAMKLYNRDGLDTWYEKDVKLKKMCMFKDGSALVQLSGKYKFGDTQAVTIHPVISSFANDKEIENKVPLEELI